MEKLSRHIAMFYLIVAFPGLVVFLVLRLCTDLGDRLLMLSLLPVGVVLLCIYILYLANPYRFSTDLRKPEDDINTDV